MQWIEVRDALSGEQTLDAVRVPDPLLQQYRALAAYPPTLWVVRALCTVPVLVPPSHYLNGKENGPLPSSRSDPSLPFKGNGRAHVTPVAVEPDAWACIKRT